MISSLATRTRFYEKRLVCVLDDPSLMLRLRESEVFTQAFDLREVDEICEITDSLPEPPGPEATRRLTQMVSGEPGPDSGGNTAARDSQYELYLRNVLRAGGIDARLGEPDLMIHTAWGVRAIEAKRPKSVPRFDDRLRGAVRQLRNHSGGIVCISLDRILRPRDSIMVVRDFDALAPAVAGLMLEFVETRAAQIAKRVRNRKLLALILAARVPALVSSTGHTSLGTSLHIEPLYEEGESDQFMLRTIRDALRTGY